MSGQDNMKNIDLHQVELARRNQMEHYFQLVTDYIKADRFVEARDMIGALQIHGIDTAFLEEELELALLKEEPKDWEQEDYKDRV